MKCSKTSWWTAVLTLDLIKHSGPTRWHVSPNHHWLWNLHVAWILCLSILPPDSGTLIFEWNERQTSSPSLGYTLLMLSLVVEWLDTRNATVVVAHVLDTSVRGGAWCAASSSVHCLWSSPTYFWMAFAWPFSLGSGYPCCCLCTFSNHDSYFHSTFYEYSWTQLSVNSQLLKWWPFEA